MNKLRKTLRVGALCLAGVLALVSCGKGDQPVPDPGKTDSLPKPVNVKVAVVGETSLDITWDAVSGAQSYGYKLQQDGKNIASGTVTVPLVKIGDLQADTEYAFQVYAAAGDVKSVFSAVLKARTAKATVPVDPENPVTTVCVDEPFVVPVNIKTPSLGTSGCISVYKGETLVDRIDLADLATVDVRADGQMVPKATIKNDTPFNTFMDAIPSGNRYRLVHYTPLRFDGSALVIKLHSGVLDFDTDYKLVVDAGVVRTEPEHVVEFRTGSKPASASAITVAADGSGDFCTVQGALSYVSTYKGAVTITVAEGTYNEMLFLRERADVTLVGASREKTEIAYANAEALETGSGGIANSKPTVGKSLGTVGGRGLFLFENCDGLRLENMTLRNTYGEQGQAEVIYFNSGSNAHKLVIENCALHSLQDTFLTKGEVYVHKSLIAGNVDFIWGYPKVCLFEECEIRCEYHKNGGYIIQARVPSASAKGFVFLNCQITAGEGAKDGSVYLARSAGQADCFDNVTYVNCSMASVIAPAGWYTNPAPNPSTPTATSGWKEYGTTGASTASRNAYGYALTESEAAAYSSRAAVLGW